MLDPDAAPSQPVLISATAAFVAALISGLFNLYNNSLRRFSGQRWWELKAHRYTELFDALFDVELYTDRLLEEQKGNSSSEEYMAKLRTRSEAGFLQIRRAAAVGPVVFDQKTSAILSQLRVALDAPDYNMSPLEYLEAQLTAIRQAKEKLRPLARKDLRVK